MKNVGEGAIEAILEARGDGGPFRSLFDFAARVDGRRVNRRVVESLVKCGAFDSLHPNRAAVWAALDAALEAGAAAQRDREIGQASLFGSAATAARARARAARARRRGPTAQRLEYEKEVLGFYVTGHPLGAVRPQLARFADTRVDDTEGQGGPRRARRAGSLTALRETRTRRGSLMAFGTLEDLEGALRPRVLRGAVRAATAACSSRRIRPTADSGPTPVLIARHARGAATRRRSSCATSTSSSARRRSSRAQLACGARRRGGDARSPDSRCARCSRASPGECAVRSTW